MIKWTNVKDGLPEVGKRVLLYESRYSYVTTGHYTGEQSEDGYGPEFYIESGDGGDIASYPIDSWAEFNYPENSQNNE